MNATELKTRYYTAAYRWFYATKGYKKAWWRELRDARTACLKAGVPV